MQVTHFSTYGPVGGAGKSAFEIHAGLRRAGCDSRMVVANAAGNHEGLVEWLGARENFALSQTAAATLNPQTDFNPDFSEIIRSEDKDRDFIGRPDVIHLHWIAGFLFASDIHELYQRYRVPIVWTLADMHPITGGCHYSHGCMRFTERCGKCPVIRSDIEDDASRQTWLSKSEWLHDLPITVVSPSTWTEALVKKSSLFSNSGRRLIPNGFDDSVFRIRRRDGARNLLRLPNDARIVMFGAANHRDERKGMRYLAEALELLPALIGEGPPVVALTVGLRAEQSRDRIPFPIVALGPVADDRLMALAYQASDVFACPSVEDNGPLMIPEALLCGTPVVAFDAAGFATDLIRAGTNGYLAKSADAHELARGIAQALFLRGSGDLSPEQCRASALPRYSSAAQAAAYMGLYDNLIHAH